MMMDKNVDRPFLSEEETRQKLNKLLFPLPPPRGVENTGLSKRKMSISLSLSLLISNFYGFVRKRKIFIESFRLILQIYYVQPLNNKKNLKKKLGRENVSLRSKSKVKKKKKKKNRSGGTRPLKIPSLSTREARRRQRQDECQVSPVGRVDFIYRSINHYNFLSRPRKNVNGRARNPKVESLFLSRGEALNFLRNRGISPANQTKHWKGGRLN